MSAIITLGNGLPVSTIAAFAEHVGSVHGCQLTGLTLVTRDGRKDPRPIVSADVVGWSPTLHRVVMDWNTVLPADWPPVRINADTLGFAEAVGRLFAAKLAIQRTRAAAGVNIGTAFPLQSTYEHSIRVDHLHADRGPMVLTLSDWRNPSQHLPMVSLVHPHVKQAHYDVSKYRGGPKLENQGELAQEIVAPSAAPDTAPTTLRTIRVKANVAAQGNNRITMYGSFLQIIGPRLPDVMVAAMAGRTLGEIAEVPRVLAHRRVLDAGVGNVGTTPSLWFDLEPDLVALKPHVRTTRADRIVDALLSDLPA